MSREQNPTLVIILASYNGETYISEQIESIFKNRYQTFTLHIFDDGSTDGTLGKIEDWVKKMPGRIVLHKNPKSKGVIQNFLQAIAKIEADYYMLCDQDDVWLKDKIGHTLQLMQSTEDSARKLPVAVFGDAKVVNAALDVLSDSFQRQSKFHSEETDLPHLLMENKLLGCTVMINHALKKKLGTFPPQIRMHDWWLGLVAASFGTIGYLDEPLLLYRQHGNNIIGNTSQKNYIKNRLTHLKKQREVLYRTCAQAEAFYEIYHEHLSREQRKIIRTFADLPKQNWFVRRQQILRYRFLKSGWIRNLGVFLVI